MWARLLNICLGVWLMASPSVLGYAGWARTISTIVGALSASFACIAIWEVTRPLRWANAALGVSLLVAVWALGSESDVATNGTIVGLLMLALALVRGEVKEMYGGGWSSLWKVGEGQLGGKGT